MKTWSHIEALSKEFELFGLCLTMKRLYYFFIDFSYSSIQIFCDIRFKFYDKQFDLKAYVTPRDFQVSLT